MYNDFKCTPGQVILHNRSFLQLYLQWFNRQTLTYFTNCYKYPEDPNDLDVIDNVDSMDEVLIRKIKGELY